MEEMGLALNPDEDILPKRSREVPREEDSAGTAKRKHRHHAVPCRHCHRFSTIRPNERGRFVCNHCEYEWGEAEMADVRAER